jgi:hypothetical protein
MEPGKIAIPSRAPKVITYVNLSHGSPEDYKKLGVRKGWI